ncbi:glycosyltransferase family 2 protein [Thermodesulfobacteriota bacterium]
MKKEGVAVSVIIPAFDEAETIGKVVEETKKLYPDYEIIVIDDGSTDGTGDIARTAGAIVYSHPYPIGIGAGIKSGVRIASGGIIVFMNGDGLHDPKDIGSLVSHMENFDMVVGKRPKGHNRSWLRRFGNWIYKRLATYVARFPIQDLTCGFRAVKSDIVHNFLYLIPNTYSYTTTLTLCTLRNGRSIKYLPIELQRTGKKRKKPGIVRDGLRFILIITRICTLYSPLRIFIPVSLVTFLLGLSNYVYSFIISGRFTNMSALLFTTSVVIFMMGLVSEQICQMRFERSEGDKNLW